MKRKPTANINSILILLLGLVGIQFTEYLLSGFLSFRMSNFLENSLFLTCILAFSFLFPPSLIRKFLLKILYLVFVAILLVEGFYFLTFDAPFSSSAVFIAFDSSPNEVQEFFSYNYTYQLTIYFIIVMLCAFFGWFVFKTIHFCSPRQQSFVLVISLSVIALTPLKLQNFPFIFAKGSGYYISLHWMLSADSSNKNGNFNDLTYEKENGEALYVIIIGESTSKAHFGLYDYKRQTTPLLASISEELVKFEDVISGHSYTIGSLMRAFSLDDTIKKGNNIIQLLNAANFKTYWLSNQTPVGIYETLVTKIAKTSNTQFFSNSMSDMKPYPFDEIIFPEFDEVLQDPSPRKVVFVHLMGAHGNYSYRYPSEFQKFYDDKADSKQVLIDHYDNAVGYTDYMVYELIQRVKKLQTKSFVLFFSDHGEEVYDAMDFAGHTPNLTLSKNMLEVPFLLWQSQEYQQSKELKIESKRKYVLNDLSHSLADLCGIDAKQVDNTKSIFNDQFIETPRIVMDTFNFDKRFSN